MSGARSVRTWGAALAIASIVVVLAARPAPWADAAQDAGQVATATRAAEIAELSALQTEVADLRTRVAVLMTPTTIVILAPVATGTATPVDCGQPVTTFGGGAASANGVSLDVLQTRAAAPVTPSPAAGVAAFAIEIVIGNDTDATLRLSPTDFRLTGCDGVLYAPIAGGPTPSILAVDVAATNTHRGWVTFALPDDVLPARFALHLPQGGRLGQPLTTERGGAAGGDAVGARVTGCDGAAGIDAIGGDGRGGDARGGDARGGDGGDGSDAVGGDAVGGNDAGEACAGG